MKNEAMILFGDARGGILHIELENGRQVPLLNGETGLPEWIPVDEARDVRHPFQNKLRTMIARMRGEGMILRR